MNTKTIDELKALAAKKLPELLGFEVVHTVRSNTPVLIIWYKTNDHPTKRTSILETEWLHICHLLEELFWNDQQLSSDYCYQLDLIVQPRREEIMINELGYTGFITHATPEQKLTAMYASNFLKD